MPREFVKKILSPRTFFVKGPDGKRQPVAFTREKIARLAANYKAMTETTDPLSISGPWRHDGSTPLLQKDLPGSRANSGFWKRLEQRADGALWGVLESTLGDRAKELEDKAALLPADDSERTRLLETAKQLRLEEEKIGTTVQHVSPYIVNEFEDGLGRKWGEAVAHVALVTKPVQPGQENFEPVKEGEPVPVIAMSDDESETIALSDDPNKTTDVPPNARSGDFQDCLKALASVGLVLPVDTDPTNLVERIIVAATAIDGANDEDDEEIPPGSQVQGGPSPVALSEGDDMAKTGKLTAMATNLAKNDYKRRIEALITTGRIGPAYAKENLLPLVDGYELSLDAEDEVVETPLDIRLEALEKLPAGTGNVLKGGKARTRLGKIALGDDFETHELSDAEADPEDDGAQAGFDQGAAYRDQLLKQRGLATN